jgi:hypothetical protein
MYIGSDDGARARSARIRSEHHWEATELDSAHRRAAVPRPETPTRTPRLGRLASLLRLRTS